MSRALPPCCPGLRRPALCAGAGSWRRALERPRCLGRVSEISSCRLAPGGDVPGSEPRSAGPGAAARAACRGQSPGGQAGVAPQCCSDRCSRATNPGLVSWGRPPAGGRAVADPALHISAAPARSEEQGQGLCVPPGAEGQSTGFQQRHRTAVGATGMVLDGCRQGPGQTGEGSAEGAGSGWRRHPHLPCSGPYTLAAKGPRADICGWRTARGGGHCSSYKTGRSSNPAGGEGLESRFWLGACGAWGGVEGWGQDRALQPGPRAEQARLSMSEAPLSSFSH